MKKFTVIKSVYNKRVLTLAVFLNRVTWSWFKNVFHKIIIFFLTLSLIQTDDDECWCTRYSSSSSSMMVFASKLHFIRNNLQFRKRRFLEWFEMVSSFVATLLSWMIPSVPVIITFKKIWTNVIVQDCSAEKFSSTVIKLFQTCLPLRHAFFIQEGKISLADMVLFETDFKS